LEPGTPSFNGDLKQLMKNSTFQKSLAWCEPLLMQHFENFKKFFVKLLVNRLYIVLEERGEKDKGF